MILMMMMMMMMMMMSIMMMLWRRMVVMILMILKGFFAHTQKLVLGRLNLSQTIFGLLRTTASQDQSFLLFANDDFSPGLTLSTEQEICIAFTHKFRYSWPAEQLIVFACDRNKKYRWKPGLICFAFTLVTLVPQFCCQRGVGTAIAGLDLLLNGTGQS